VEMVAPPLATDPGFAAPGPFPMSVLLAGAAACVLLPILARRLALRRAARPAL